jgi:uncharacterized secreted protein with C-terminal beta-propeller domain
MDEYKGNFRIATTTGGWISKELNHLYVLNENLETIGKLEDLAEDEIIYSVRFLGDRAYMVTFKQIDPLFVIDVSNAKNPKVLGYLKITGYSSYLHPYDENTIIGIGMEADERGRTTGMKISVFDVSDVSNPIEKSKYEFEKGSYSSALYEHKAFLFDKNKEILVLPVQINDYKDYKNSWQGVYVFKINLEEISLKGKITHEEEIVVVYDAAKNEPIGATRKDLDGNVWTKTSENGWEILENIPRGYESLTWGNMLIDKQPGGINYIPYLDWKNQIQRTLFMDEFIYTVSLSKIKSNNLNNLEEIKTIDLGYEGYYLYYEKIIDVI